MMMIVKMMTTKRMVMIETMMVLVQANLELKERMESALDREERARAELQDSKDQVRITRMGDE